MHQRFSIVAVVVSLLALALSAVNYCQADARAEAALRRREREVIKRYAGTIRKTCEELGIRVAASEPETLEELLEPLVKLGAGLSK